MRKILTEIQTGQFAKEFILENKAGAPTLKAMRRIGQAAPDRNGRREAARHDAVDQEEQAG